jgi:hypothetical protein
MLLICAGSLLTSISAHSSAFTALSTEEHKEKFQLGEGEGQTGVEKRVYIVRQSFLRCSGPSVVEVCADTIKSPISRIFYGKFRMTSQDDAVKVESWRRFQLDIQVRRLPFYFTFCRLRCSCD